MSDATRLVTSAPAIELIQPLAYEMLLRSGEIATKVTEQVLVRLPQLAPHGEPEAVDALRESTDQNVGALLSTLAFGVPATSAEPPLGARKLMRQLLAAGADITDMLRAYRYGHELTWRHWSAFVAGRLSGSEHLVDVLTLSSEHMFTFIDRCCDVLVAEYRREFGGLRPVDLDRSPAEVVHALLGDGPTDESAASALLRYDVNGFHVALVAAPLVVAADPQAAIEAICAVAGGSVLVLPNGDGTWWAWLTWAGEPASGRLDAVAATVHPGVLITMGSPGTGRAGFRRSHREAMDADRTVRLGRRPRAGVIPHREVEMAGLLCGDPDRALRVARERLGALATADELGERLRETLLTHLAHGSSKARTAALLHVHYKTVTYRLAQAEELLGHHVDEEIVDVVNALVILRTLRDG